MKPPEFLTQALRVWRVSPPPDPNFRGAVWQRIEDTHRTTSWPVFVRRARRQPDSGLGSDSRRIRMDRPCICPHAGASRPRFACRQLSGQPRCPRARWLEGVTSVKNALIAAVVFAATALVAGVLGYRAGCDPALHQAARQGDAMVWLRREFHLTDAQYAAIERLHSAYNGTCEEHCRMIQEAMTARDALRAAHPADAEAVAAADRHLRDLSAVAKPRCFDTLRKWRR